MSTHFSRLRNMHDGAYFRFRGQLLPVLEICTSLHICSWRRRTCPGQSFPNGQRQFLNVVVVAKFVLRNSLTRVVLRSTQHPNPATLSYPHKGFLIEAPKWINLTAPQRAANGSTCQAAIYSVYARNRETTPEISTRQFITLPTIIIWHLRKALHTELSKHPVYPAST